MAKVTVLGGGTWGIGLTILLANAGHDVIVWSAVESEIEMLSTTHAHKMLPGATIPEKSAASVKADTMPISLRASFMEASDILLMTGKQ